MDDRTLSQSDWQIVIIDSKAIVEEYDSFLRDIEAK